MNSIIDSNATCQHNASVLCSFDLKLSPCPASEFFFDLQRLSNQKSESVIYPGKYGKKPI
jgi:hypothetical protein